MLLSTEQHHTESEICSVKQAWKSRKVMIKSLTISVAKSVGITIIQRAVHIKAVLSLAYNTQGPVSNPYITRTSGHLVTWLPWQQSTHKAQRLTCPHHVTC